MTTSLTRPRLVDLDTFSRAAGVHPEFVRRIVRLGLLEPATPAASDLRFAPAQLARIARLQRLRAGFSLNYAALGLVCDLLDRIAELEQAPGTAPRRQGGGA